MGAEAKPAPPSEAKPGPPSEAKPGPPSEAKPRARGPEVTPLGVIAFVIFVLVGGVLVFAFAWVLVPSARAQGEVACRPFDPQEVAFELPTATYERLDGTEISLDEYEGKFLVVNFWGTYCEPCTKEWPDLDKLGRRFEGREDIIVLAISIDPEKPDIMPYLERMTLTDSPVEVLWDPTGKTAAAFGGDIEGADKIPNTYFVDKEGVIRSAFIDTRPWGRPEAYRCVDRQAS